MFAARAILRPLVRLLVQHHPARQAELARLTQSLCVPPEVICDPDPDSNLKSPWRTYRVCLEQLAEGEGVIVQDDAVATPRFTDAVEVAARARPGRLIAFFHGGYPHLRVEMLRAIDRGDLFVEISGGSFVPTVALYWPAGEAAAFLDYIDHKRRRPVPRWNRGDDSLIGEWVMKHRKGALVTAPCLVEHPDDSPSLIGASHRNGSNRLRVAAASGSAEDWITQAAQHGIY